MPATLYLTLLLALFPCVPARSLSRIAAAREHIVREAERARAEHGVPVSVLLVVAYGETHLGTDDGEGGNWGAPASRAQRHTAGTPEDAARALAWSFSICGSWRGAVARFRSGLCRPHNRTHLHDVAVRVRLIERLEESAGLSLPERF